MHSTLLKFEKLHNIRDLGGMKTQDGKTILPGRLLRCGHLADLIEPDRRHMEELLSVIVDFRTDDEKNRQPDLEIAGTEYHHLPVVDSLTPGITREEEADLSAVARLLFKPREAREYMCDLYRGFASGTFVLSQYAKFIRLLLQPRDRAVLWHCTAGKDRAGIGSVLVQALLGVSREDIYDDYLFTAECLKDDGRTLTAWLMQEAKTNSPLADESIGYLFGTREEYLDSFYHSLEKQYGSMAAFLREGVGIREEEEGRLRELYLA